MAGDPALRSWRPRTSASTSRSSANKLGLSTNTGDIRSKRALKEEVGEDEVHVFFYVRNQLIRNQAEFSSEN